MKSLFFVCTLLFSLAPKVSAQILLPNETNLFSFKTHNNKTVTLAQDKDQKYMVYRFGTPEKIELEYPEKELKSYNKFKYSFYMRGGGKMNEGMDVNFVSFIQGDYKYVLYATYYAIDEKSEIGIKVIHLKTNKTTKIKGQLKSQKGSLIDFRYNELLSIDDQLYE
ncbi:hypothetical protein KIH23_02595 [Flavobacterium sp. CYK-55]|uniref:hypothetical protein n=1 Tax=Flavobacterium sp. CYK-55 TaxID=2835529 RepID=UPI001BCFADED|nr:hypothetical protein [Flavobacterium sp. CYK-55]MBS7786173.1 hypothetical protein [Flavobacterium sp. CYK-55]